MPSNASGFVRPVLAENSYFSFNSDKVPGSVSLICLYVLNIVCLIAFPSTTLFSDLSPIHIARAFSNLSLTISLVPDDDLTVKFVQEYTDFPIAASFILIVLTTASCRSKCFQGDVKFEF